MGEKPPANNENPPSPSTGFGAGLKRLAKSAKDSSVAQKATEAAASAGKVVAETARSADARRAVLDVATPTVHGALDGAKLRNKKGKVKVWRVARAAARPRKSLTRASQGAAGASATQIRSVIDGSVAPNARLPENAYSDAQIRAEWPQDDILAHWESGVSKFESTGDDTEIREVARLMCVGLASCLTSTPAIPDDSLVVESVGNVMAIVLSEDDPDRWDDEERRLLRVALAVARRTGTQPVALGGNGELELLFDGVTTRMRMAMSLSSDGWSCDLSHWFGQ